MGIETLNLEQLGTAGIFIMYLIWQIQVREKVIERVDDERRQWQERAFNSEKRSAEERSALIQTIDKAIEAVR